MLSFTVLTINTAPDARLQYRKYKSAFRLLTWTIFQVLIWVLCVISCIVALDNKLQAELSRHAHRIGA